MDICTKTQFIMIGKMIFFFYPLIYFYFCFDLELEMIIYFDLFYMSYNDTKKNPTQ